MPDNELCNMYGSHGMYYKCQNQLLTDVKLFEHNREDHALERLERENRKLKRRLVN